MCLRVCGMNFLNILEKKSKFCQTILMNIALSSPIDAWNHTFCPQQQLSPFCGSGSSLLESVLDLSPRTVKHWVKSAVALVPYLNSLTCSCLYPRIYLLRWVTRKRYHRHIMLRVQERELLYSHLIVKIIGHNQSRTYIYKSVFVRVISSSFWFHLPWGTVKNEYGPLRFWRKSPLEEKPHITSLVHHCSIRNAGGKWLPLLTRKLWLLPC